MSKKYNKTAIKDMIYGTVKELADTPEFYWKGVSDSYSHLTDEGKEQLTILVERMIPLIHAYEDEDFEDRAKELTFSLLNDQKDPTE
jgi:hypothetical protein